jgi:REP element-mobilizing transposase RayT
MILSEVGLMVHSVIVDSDAWHPRVHVDVFQIMPDHIHAIIVLRDTFATTSSTGYGSSRDDATVGAGPRACPRDEPNQPPPRRRVASIPEHPVSDPTRAHLHRPIEPSPNPPRLISDDRPPRDVRNDHREPMSCDHPDPTRRNDREPIPSNDRDTHYRGILGGSAHPGCRGQARGPAPTGSSFRDASYPIDDVVAYGSSFRDASYPIDVVAHVTLPDVVQRIKSLTTARYRHAVANHGWPPFAGRLWQRNYYERIIRDDRALATIRRYIRANPRNWLEPRRPYCERR